MERDYNREMEALLSGLDGKRPRLLLHACCAPCASAVLERLYPHFKVTLYYCNPNIHPAEEYRKRAGEFPKLLKASGMEDVELLIPEYDPEPFFMAAKGLESAPEGGERCGKCFELRLSAAARLAKEGNYAYFCTTLTVSPHKNARLINAVGERLSGVYGVPWLPSDFKKKDGYLRSVRLCQQYGIYRQSRCGCAYSDPAIRKPRVGAARPPVSERPSGAAF